MEVSTYTLVLVLMVQGICHTIKVKSPFIIKFTYQSQQRNLHNLPKKRTGSMKVTIVMGNKEYYMIWNILKILKMLMRLLYLVLSPFILG